LTDLHSEKFLKKLVGRIDIENVTTKLDKLTQEEALMAHTRSLELLLSVESKVDIVIDGEQHCPAIFYLSLQHSYFRWNSSESSDTTDRERPRWFEPFVTF
jgi:hypothetical protein